MRSGYAGLQVGALIYAGIDGYDWSSVAGVFAGVHTSWNTKAHALAFNTTIIHSSDSPTARWLGFPVRCLASGA